MSEIVDLFETVKEREARVALEREVLSGILKKIKTMIQDRVIVNFNKNSDNEFGISAFEIYYDQKTGIFKVQLDGLYDRVSGEGVYKGSFTESTALDALEKELEGLIKKNTDAQMEVSVACTFYSK